MPPNLAIDPMSLLLNFSPRSPLVVLTSIGRFMAPLIVRLVSLYREVGRPTLANATHVTFGSVCAPIHVQDRSSAVHGCIWAPTHFQDRSIFKTDPMLCMVVFGHRSIFKTDPFSRPIQCNVRFYFNTGSFSRPIHFQDRSTRVHDSI